MEVENLADGNTDDVLIEENENAADPSTPGQKGVKRVASTPPEKDVKKPKVGKSKKNAQNDDIQLSPNTSSHSIEVLEESPQKGFPNTPKTPKTPKITKEEREKLKKEKMEEKEKQKAERERILEEKRLEKEKIAEEKRLEKEKKEKERLEKKLEEDRKKEERRKEAEEKKRKEEEEKNRKKKEEEEKKEAKRKEEEEKKEAKRKEEEALEEKKRRESARFLGFFSKVEKKKVPVETQKDTSSWYRPFERKDGMTMAPILQRAPLPVDFDIWAMKDESVTIRTFLDAAAKLEIAKPNSMKAKLFQFHENRRPPYYGTWRKKAKIVRGWCPLEDQEDGIDYEVDSDEEWEDEPSDCEECNSDDDGEKDEEDENEEDDGFFVPPCYLSDGEGEDDSTDPEGKKLATKTKRVAIESDDEDGEASNETEERKARLAQRASEWSKRTEKKKMTKMEPRAIGPVFPPADAPAEFIFMAATHFY